MITHLAIATLWNRTCRLRNMFTIQGVLNIINTNFFLAAANEMTVLKFSRQCQSINKLCLLFLECLNAYLICLVYLRSQVPWKWQFWHMLLCRSRYTCSICLRHVHAVYFDSVGAQFFYCYFLLIFIYNYRIGPWCGVQFVEEMTWHPLRVGWSCSIFRNPFIIVSFAYSRYIYTHNDF